MHFTKHFTHRFAPRLLLLFFPTFYCLNPDAVGVAAAQQPESITQSQSSADPTTSQPAPTRPKPPFFEESRKARFGFGDFVQSALDGVQNYFSADLITNLSPQFSLNPLSDPLGSNLSGILTVQSRNKRDANYLTTTFIGPGVNLTLSSPNQSADPRIGTINVNGTVTVNGRTITFNNVRRDYSGSFATRNNDVSGAILVVDPQDPNTSIFIQLPLTNIPNVKNDRQPISGQAQFSIGLPSDR